MHYVTLLLAPMKSVYGHFS